MTRIRVCDTGAMLDRLPLSGTLEALAALTDQSTPVEARIAACGRACREAAPGADPRTLTWPQLLAAAARLGCTVVNLDPAGRVDRAFGGPEGEFDGAVEGLKAALVGVMAQAAAPGGRPLAGVLAAVPLKEGVLAVVVRSLNRQKDGAVIAWVSEPGFPEVRYDLDGMCFLAAAACRRSG